ncbi:hypothetical protein HK105_209001 [Polyrhizophydium stewartii]|uniref:Carrier domain-containing protein n=1 Tax=Polyrhizophydium stewartii TaxID=2732419 RepID=A0ABR4MWA0_9FUNG
MSSPNNANFAAEPAANEHEQSVAAVAVAAAAADVSPTDKATTPANDAIARSDHVTFWRSQLAADAPLAPLSLGGPRTAPGLVPPPAPRTVPLPTAAGLSTSAVAVAVAATISKLKRSSDIIVGIAVAGTDRTIVPVRIVLDDSTTVSDAVAAAAESIRAATEHSPVDLVQLRAWCGLSPSDPVCDVVLCIGKVSNASLQADLASTGASFAIAVDTSAVGGSVTCIHDGRRLDVDQAATIVDEFAFTIGHLLWTLADKGTVESLWTLSPAQQAMIARFSHGERAPLPFALVHHGFEARAKQHPDWRAVEHGDAHLSYGDLDACGSALAAALASHGVQRGSRVAVVMQRSIEFVVALVGVLKAGATIVPVDSSFPADRIQFMLDDASVCAIVTTASEAGRIAQLSVGDRAVVVADARALLASGVSFTPAAQHMATGDDDAFIVYTSGSTGKPKGVPVPHKGVVNVVALHSLGFVERARVPQFMAIGFDDCAARRAEAILVTRHWGEMCPKELKDLWLPHVVMTDVYGPTETSIMSHATAKFRLVLLASLMSTRRHASRGYINLPDMTAQRFVPDPFSPEPGARMFRTGDLGRLLPDGNFEILGRMDDQVKLKGYRIELDEVAAAMMRHPRVSAAAAVVKDKTHLVGFVVPADVDHDELRDVVAAALPAYMVPAVFVGLAVMPTNTNGKTDKKALAAMHVEIAVDALQTDTERALAAVWSQVLGVHVADIGRATSFFALGGDSISAIRLVAKAKQQGLTLSSALIFKAPTLAKMALAATVSETRAAVSSAPVTGSVALTPIQHMFFAHDWINISHFNQSFVVTPRDTLDIAALTAAIARLAEHHDMLRARFAQGDDGAWSQTLLPPSPIDTENVLAVAVESDDDALACIREAQESLSITHGPLLAVRLLHMHDGSQRLFFGIHHLVVDFVSWQIIFDDLETLLRGRPLAPKTLSFQAWAARMAAHAATLDAAPWRDLIGDHTTLLATQPPAAGVPVRAFHARAVLDEATTAQLDAANAPFNTNIQELVLAALVLSLADVAGCASSPAQLCIELEGHGRESFAADLDVSSTVGWFTSVFPVAFSASTASDIGAVVRQVKHKIRSVPLKGLSYGMIKHLAPPTADNAFVKAHGGHPIVFNYFGRFQSLEAADAFFV